MRPALPKLRIVASCDASYADMRPVDGGRYCAECDRVIPNLSELTRREAIALFHAKGRDLCGFLAHDARGEPIFAPERPASLLAATVLAGALAACEASPTADPTLRAVEAARDTDDARVEPPDTTASQTVMVPMESTPSADRAACDTTPRDPDDTLGTDTASPEQGLEQGSDEGAEAAEPGTEPQTDEERALEARKRRRRRVAHPRPHAQMLGMLDL